MIIEYYTLSKGSDYNDMAVLYRSIKNPEPLKARIKKSEEVKYAAESIKLRIRMSWKPVPAPVLHQTPENEPEVIVGCTTKRAIEIIDAMKDIKIQLKFIEYGGHPVGYINSKYKFSVHFETTLKYLQKEPYRFFVSSVGISYNFTLISYHHPSNVCIDFHLPYHYA